jgi:WG containing repeat
MTMTNTNAQSRIKGDYDPTQAQFFPKNSKYSVGPTVDGYAVIEFEGKFGIIDTKGNFQWPIEQLVQPLRVSIKHVREPEMIHMIDFGYLVISEDGYLVGGNSLCSGGNHGTYFLCDSSGTLVLPYRLIWPNLLDRYSMLKPNGLIHFTRYEAIPGDIECIRCGYCYGYMGILNTKGETIVAPDRYRDIADFHSGRARVMLDNGKYGYIDEKGCEVIPCTFDEADNFLEGKAQVTQGKKTFEIGIDGKRL